MSKFAIDRIAKSERMPGILEVNSQAPIGQVIEDLLLVVACSESEDWEDKIGYLPFSS